MPSTPSLAPGYRWISGEYQYLVCRDKGEPIATIPVTCSVNCGVWEALEVYRAATGFYDVLYCWEQSGSGFFARKRHNPAAIIQAVPLACLEDVLRQKSCEILKACSQPNDTTALQDGRCARLARAYFAISKLLAAEQRTFQA